jgi:VWFA-related protein
MIARGYCATTTAVVIYLSGGLSAQRATTTFQSGIDGVLVPVSVSESNRPVRGLTASDFELLDNGVPQQFACAVAESLPVDVTLVLDTSGSVQGRLLERFKTDVQEIAESLEPNDRVRLITFAVDATDTSGLQPGAVSLPLDRASAGSATSLYNALAAALIAYPHSDRPQMVFTFTDGLDNMSFLDASSVVTVAGHSTAALYLALVSRGNSAGMPPMTAPLMTPAIGNASRPTSGPRFVPYIGEPNTRLLADAARRTGGTVYQRPAGTSLSAVFKQALDEFRSSYVLTFTPRGGKSAGWHKLVVKTKNPRHRLRWRQGYDGG